MSKNENLLPIAIATLITITLWIGIDTYLTYKKTTFNEVDQEMLSPIDPEISFEGVLR